MVFVALPNKPWLLATFDFGDGISTNQWGDEKVTKPFPPEYYTYTNTNKNYIISITIQWADHTTDSITCVAYLLSVLKPISLPDDIKVTIPSTPVSFTIECPDTVHRVL